MCLGRLRLREIILSSLAVLERTDQQSQTSWSLGTLAGTFSGLRTTFLLFYHKRGSESSLKTISYYYFRELVLTMQMNIQVY